MTSGASGVPSPGPVADSSRSTDALLEIRNMSKEFPVGTGSILRRKTLSIKAVQDVSFSIRRGETLGLVGESGSGKTTLGRCILRLHEPTSGEVLLNGENVLNLRRSELQAARRRMQIIFQDPYSSLDPRMNAGNIVGEGLLIHNLTNSKSEYRERIAELFELVGLSPTMMNRFPHEFSGGQRQRIGIARALAVDPDFIVCDEPVSALDVSIQAQILNLLEELQARLNLTYLFVAHDLSVVRHISDRIAVMYLGRIVEIADGDELYQNPRHPYTRALMSGIPIPDPVIEETRDRVMLTGEIPSPLNPPSGCVFNPRCPLADDRCPNVVPELRTISTDHFAACINAEGYGDV